ncbi:type 4b pilus protein PilO2 [Paludibacterium paludis]|uniref:Pilin accessory protein (PilO) n=1 Tax=Paludibacterium paludis TaxID=1225769 RepID=A0A918UAV4_9NEIS|nr:type 4b pilus protein PilO2 [Paludibacterium paludis]GGY20815.1 hypothetical protein GCM10011289_25560 [Paludibacterium paludis]
MTEGQIQLFRYKGKRFATGLSWMPVANDVATEEQALQRARELAGNLQPAPNRHVVQNDPKTQRPLAVGLGHLKSGTAHSLALTLMAGIAKNAPARSWMALIAIPGQEDQFAFVAVLNDAVMPGSDRLFQFEDALDWARQRLSLGVWDAVFVDTRFMGELDDPSVREADLDSLLTGIKPGEWPKLQSPSRRLPPKVRKYGPIGIAAIVLLGGGLTGLHAWQQHLAQQRAAAQAAIHPPPPPKPWLATAGAHTVLLECVKALSDAPVTRGGWSFDSLDCHLANRTLTTTVKWKQGKGEVADLLHAAPGAAFDAKKGLASLTTKVTLPARNDDPRVFDTVSAAIRLDDIGQRYGLTELTSSADVKNGLARLGKGPGNIRPQQPNSRFKPFSLKFVKRAPLFTLSQLDTLFAGLPGLRFDDILVDRTGQFTVTGKLYAYQ